MDDNPWGAPTPTTPSPRPNQHDVDPIQTLGLAVGGPSNERSTSLSTISSAHWDASSSSPSMAVREEVQEQKVETEGDVDQEVEDEETVEQITPAAPTEPETSSTHESDDDEPKPPARDDDKDSEGYSSPPPPPTMVRSPSNPLALPPMEEGPPMDDFDDDESGPTPSAPDDDDFDDFGEAAEAGGDDDDFGDFGDFGETNEGDADGFEGFDEPPPAVVTEAPPVRPSAHVASPSFAAFQSTGHPPLLLDLTDPSKSAIAEQLQGFFEGLYPGAQDVVSDEPERQVEGVGQVLASESTRTLLAGLSSLPALKPLDWRRSRIRREHLIVLGVPINLDDTAPVKLASLTLPPQRSNSPHTTRSPTSALSTGGSISRSTTPFADRERARAQHHQVPILDRRLADSLLALKEDDLAGLSLADLQTKVREMDRVTEEASAALTYALVTRDKESSDAETYNGMIQDLVAAAAKTKTTSAAGGRSSPALKTASGRWGRSAVK